VTGVNSAENRLLESWRPRKGQSLDAVALEAQTGVCSCSEGHVKMNEEKMTQSQDNHRMISLASALALVDQMRGDFYAALPAERIAAEAAVGRVLAEDVISRLNVPAYDLCTMDGYAIRAADQYPLRIVGEAFAGRGFRPIGPGEAVYVTTGARLPAGADAILIVEDAQVIDGMLRGPALKPETHVVRAGADFTAGTVVMQRGSLLAPATQGILHMAGVDRVAVFRRPRVAVLATGDEILDGTVPDANGPMVCSLLTAWGCAPSRFNPVGDDRSAIVEALATSLRDYDLIITIGGVSLGKMDLMSSIAESGRVVFKGVRVKPGKPFIASYLGEKPVFSLPGKPSGSYAIMELFIRRFLLGTARRRTVCVPVSQDVELPAPGFDYMVFVEFRDGKAQPVGFEGSSLKLLAGPEYNTSLLSTSARTTLSDGYFIARGTIKAGQLVTVNLS
jgi:molybdopterin molybdotransferase